MKNSGGGGAGMKNGGGGGGGSGTRTSGGRMAAGEYVLKMNVRCIHVFLVSECCLCLALFSVQCLVFQRL